MTILVLGGAGYIGSHAVDQLVQKGYQVAVVDNLLTGHKKAVHPDAHFYEGDIRDKEFLRSVFEKEPIEGVIHFAASSLVGESVEKCKSYLKSCTSSTSIKSYSLLLQQLMESRKSLQSRKIHQLILKIRMVKAN